MRQLRAINLHHHGEEGENEIEAELEMSLHRVERPDDSIAVGVEEDDVRLKYSEVLVSARPVTAGRAIGVLRVGGDVGARRVCMSAE